jgi:hypothetical protein
VPLGVLPAVVLLRPTLAGLARPGTEQPVERAPIAWAACAAVAAGVLHLAGHRLDPAGLALLVAALAGLAVALPQLVPTGTFRAVRGLPAVIALRGLFAAGFFSAEVFIPLMLTRERGLSPALAGAALTIGSLSWALGSNLQARFTRPEHRTRLLRWSAVSVAVAVVCAAVTAVLPVPTALTVAGWTLAGLGMGAAYPTLSLLSLQLAEHGRQGAASSALQISDSMTSSVALAVSGAVFAALIGAAPQTAYLAGFGIAAAFLVAAMLVAPRASP